MECGISSKHKVVTFILNAITVIASQYLDCILRHVCIYFSREKTSFHVSNGIEMSYEINLQDIEEVTAAHVYMGQDDENGPFIVTLFDPDTRTGEINDET